MSVTAIAVKTMTAAQIARPGAGFELVEREVPEPAPDGAHQVLPAGLSSECSERRRSWNPYRRIQTRVLVLRRLVSRSDGRRRPGFAGRDEATASAAELRMST